MKKNQFNSIKLFCLISITGLIYVPQLSYSQDRFFAQTYTSGVLPKDGIDLEFWHTSRMGHRDQYFHAMDQRMELEYGLGKNIQTAFYFNRYSQRYSVSDSGTVNNNEIGFSNEWKWKCLSQDKNKIGMALYGEWGIKGGDELELESKIIMDKWFGKHLIAFNGVVELEKGFQWLHKRTSSEGWELPVEFDLGYMYNPAPRLGLGIEIRNNNLVSKDNHWEHSIFFGGPTINFRGDGWFIVANYLPQWINIRKTAVAPYSKVLDEHERMEARILFGVSLK